MAVDVMLSMPLILHGSKDWMAVQQGGSTTGKDCNGRRVPQTLARLNWQTACALDQTAFAQRPPSLKCHDSACRMWDAAAKFELRKRLLIL